eukprot:EG_transcript_17838
MSDPPSVEACSSSTMRRGHSFVQEYSKPPPQLCRGPSMIKSPYADLLPPTAADRYTVVLDLDETVIYARQGPLEVRPYFDEFLGLLDDCCEVIVWTAGIRNYAKAVIRNIDRQNVIAHCIYRHEKWFRPGDYTKDLAMLGRAMDKVLIVENTADCVRNNPENGVIVQDYEGGAGMDATMKLLAGMIQELCRSGASVPHFLRGSPLVERQQVAGQLGEVEVYFLKTTPSETKEVKENLDRVDHKPDTAKKEPHNKKASKAPKRKARASSSDSWATPTRRSKRLAAKRRQERLPWR